MVVLCHKKQFLVLGITILILLFYFKPRCRNVEDQVLRDSDVSPLPYIYGITPTYRRMNQKPELTRLSQTLMHLKKFHWIVVEDSVSATKFVTDFLKKSTLKYTHLYVKTGNISRNQENFAKGVEQRNLGLQWLREHLKIFKNRRGVLYFMDDDNTYDLKIFEEMRKIKKVGVWPVGLVGFLRVETPIVIDGRVAAFNAVWKRYCHFPIDILMRKIKKVGVWPVGLVGFLRVETPIVKDGRVAAFNAVWKRYRPFPIDMAGFAINLSLIMSHPEAKFNRLFKKGYQESVILSYITTVEELEPLANNCTEVYVWHTRTHPSRFLYEKDILDNNTQRITIISIQ